jgi:hypothetical protein
MKRPSGLCEANRGAGSWACPQKGRHPKAKKEHLLSSNRYDKLGSNWHGIICYADSEA